MSPQAPAGLQTLTAQMKGLYDRFMALNQKKKSQILGGVGAFCFFCFVMICIVYTMTGVKKSSRPQRAVIVFMDALPSDFLALKYLFKRSDIKVAMIVLNIVGLNQNLRSAYDNTQRLLQQLGREGSMSAAAVPVVYGEHVATYNANS